MLLFHFNYIISLEHNIIEKLEIRMDASPLSAGVTESHYAAIRSPDNGPSPVPGRMRTNPFRWVTETDRIKNRQGDTFCYSAHQRNVEMPGGLLRRRGDPEIGQDRFTYLCNKISTTVAPEAWARLCNLGVTCRFPGWLRLDYNRPEFTGRLAAESLN